MIFSVHYSYEFKFPDSSFEVLCRFPLRKRTERLDTELWLCEKCSSAGDMVFFVLSFFCDSSVKSVMIVSFYPCSCYWDI